MRMAKETKPQSVKLYDSDGFKKRAACVCVRNEAESEVGSNRNRQAWSLKNRVSRGALLGFKILLVSSSKHSEFWIIPGGGVEDNEKPEDTALREVREEAGVHGHLGRLLGVFEVTRLPMSSSQLPALEVLLSLSCVRTRRRSTEPACIFC